jgi:hypothetical protein
MLEGLAGKVSGGFEYGIFVAYNSNFGLWSLFMKLSGAVENYKILQSKYDGSWRKMWLLRPRLRIDGKCSYLLLHSLIS